MCLAPLADRDGQRDLGEHHPMGLLGETFKRTQLVWEVHPLPFVLVSLLLPTMWA